LSPLQRLPTADKTAAIFSFHQQTLAVQQPLQRTQIPGQKALEPAIKTIAVKPDTHSALCRYLDTKKLPFKTGEKYCKDVEFEPYDKRYSTIGFESTSEEFELGNEYFKGSILPKNITLLEGDKGIEN
jgi:hypothetical protein